MELFKEKEECCGCSACKSVCPVQAIGMQADEQGFLYPSIDEETCIHCGRCERVCPFKDEKDLDDFDLQDVYAVRNTDEKIRMSSSSGGFFYTIAAYILQNGGSVYGAVFDEEFQVVHRRGTSVEDLCSMQGAKYVQSNLDGCFELVKQDLLNHKTVLFTGCPCQIDGLRGYLKGCNLDKLVTCDLICHGVNSPKFWKEYLSYIKRKDMISGIYFRDKSFGWRKTNM